MYTTPSHSRVYTFGSFRPTPAVVVESDNHGILVAIQHPYSGSEQEGFGLKVSANVSPADARKLAAALIDLADKQTVKEFTFRVGAYTEEEARRMVADGQG